MYASMHVYTYVSACVYVYMCAYMCMYVCVCMYVSVFTRNILPHPLIHISLEFRHCNVRTHTEVERSDPNSRHRPTQDVL